MPILAVDGVTISFHEWGKKHVAVDGASLQVPRGQWIVLAGHNGSGKSSLLKAIAGRIAVDRGTIRVGARPIASLGTSELPAHVFLVHQDPLLGTAPLLTVSENLYVADPARGPKKALFARYRELLRPLGLEEKGQALVRTLSGGERRLISLLVARLQSAPLILLDEPFAALDPQQVSRCIKEIEMLSAEGRTILQVSHEVEHLGTLGDRTVVMKDGRIVYDELGDQRSVEAICARWYQR